MAMTARTKSVRPLLPHPHHFHRTDKNRQEQSEGWLERIAQRYPVESRPQQFVRTLEIGAGTGHHLRHEELSPEQEQHYYALESCRYNCARLQTCFPLVQTITGDCQTRLPFVAGYFERIVAVQVLEHLPDVEATIHEMYRLCDKTNGVVSLVVGCGGRWRTTLAKWLQAGESVTRTPRHRLPTLRAALTRFFAIEQQQFFPQPVPWHVCNLLVGMTLRPRPCSS